MENRKETIIRIFGAIIIIILLTVIAVRKPHDMTPPTIETCKEDSLQNVINQLKIEIENEEDGWDDKEKRYEQILFEYEFGLDHLKHYHSDAYKEFHRIVGYKERYSSETERENKKRLKTNGKYEYD
jgi:hypothetical protein